MRSHEEFKSEVLKRSNNYKNKRKKQMKIVTTVICLMLFIPTSKELFSNLMVKEASIENCDDSTKVNEQSNYKEEYNFKDEKSINQIKNKLSEYNWSYEEIGFVGKTKIKVYIDNQIIEIIDNKLIYDNKWTTLEEREIKNFIEFIQELEE